MGTQKPERPVPLSQSRPGKHGTVSSSTDGCPSRAKAGTDWGLLAVTRSGTETNKWPLWQAAARASLNSASARASPGRLPHGHAEPHTGRREQEQTQRSGFTGLHTLAGPLVAARHSQTKEPSRDPREPGWAGVGPTHARLSSALQSQDTWCALRSGGTTQPGPPDPRRSL